MQQGSKADYYEDNVTRKVIIEYKLKTKSYNRGQRFRPYWVSSTRCSNKKQSNQLELRANCLLSTRGNETEIQMFADEFPDIICKRSPARSGDGNDYTSWYSTSCEQFKNLASFTLILLLSLDSRNTNADFCWKYPG